MPLQKLKIEDWYLELKKVAKRKYDMDNVAEISAWKDHYDEGYSPLDAIDDDLSYWN